MQGMVGTSRFGELDFKAQSLLPLTEVRRVRFCNA